MITIDVDDTLLNDQWQVTDETKQALKDAIECGVTVTLATGRMFASAKQIASQIGLNVPLITYQGSLIKNLLDDHVLYERFVPSEVTTYLFDYAKQHGLHMQGYYDDRLFAIEDNEKIKKYSELAKVPYTIVSAEHLVSRPMIKLLIYDDPHVLDEHAEALRKVIGAEVHITKSKPYFLEFLHKEATKGHAVQFLADHFGCELSQVIAIGDSWNDHEMLEVAGMGVAMGNAVDSLKQIADFITKTNNEDGVKHVIDTFILNKKK